MAILSIVRGWWLSYSLLCFASAEAADSIGMPEVGGFSGVFSPRGRKGMHHYAGACLLGTKRLVEAEGLIANATRLEDVGFSLCGYSLEQDKEQREAVQTRDYFDFSVVHLSSTTNQIPNQKLREPIHEQALRMVDQQRLGQLEYNSTETDSRLRENTVALIPFSSLSHSNPSPSMAKAERDIRVLYFKATFYSVYRYIPNVVVAVGSATDYQLVSGLQLPIFKLLDFREKFVEGVEDTHPHSQTRLPRYSVLQIINRLQSGAARLFHPFHYFFYTECDQILKFRPGMPSNGGSGAALSVSEQLLDLIDNSGGLTAVAPHRLQSIPLPSNFPPHYRDIFKDSPRERAVRGARYRVIDESPLEPRGSCCDSGTYSFSDCGSWWYNCIEYGLRNASVWLRFQTPSVQGTAGAGAGVEGATFTVPTITEHAGACLYSAERVTCPLPARCRGARMPTRAVAACMGSRLQRFVGPTRSIVANPDG